MMVMFKQKQNEMILIRRNIHTRAPDVLLLTTICPNNEKYKRNIHYKGAQIWNTLSVNN